MKCRSFFRRMDIVRNWCRALFIPYAIFVYYSNVGWKESITRYIAIQIFLWVILGVMILGALLKVKSKDKITQYVAEERGKFTHGFSTVRQAHMCFLGAFGEENAKYARAVGNKLLFPTCLAVGVEHTPDGGVSVHTKEIDLYAGANRDLPSVDLGKSVIFTCSPWDKENTYCIVRLASGIGDDAKVAEFILRSNYEWEGFLKFMREECGVQLM